MRWSQEKISWSKPANKERDARTEDTEKVYLEMRREQTRISRLGSKLNSVDLVVVS